MNRLISSVLGVLLAGLLGCSSETQTPAETSAETRWTLTGSIIPRSYGAVFLETPPDIDGKIEEGVWDYVPWSEPFMNIEGPDHPAPHVDTRFKMGWDDDFLYIAAVMEETDIWGVRTDSTKPVWRDPDLEVFIDPDGDTHDYFEFQINVLGTTNQIHFPRAYGDRGRSDRRAWFSGLETGVFIAGTANNRSDRDDFWSVELAMPWAGFARYQTNGQAPTPGDIWRMNASRVHWDVAPDSLTDGYVKLPDQGPGTNWSWTPQGLVLMHVPEMWGYIQFVEDAAAFQSIQPDPARDCLFDTYYRQRAHFERTETWALSLSELFSPNDLDSRCALLALEADSLGFVATFRDGDGDASIDHRRHFNRPAITARSIDLR